MEIILPILLLLSMVAAVATVAGRIGVPAPALYLILGMIYGATASFTAAPLPALPYESGVVFAVFFPAMLFASAYHMPWNDLRVNLWRNLLLSLSTVVATTFVLGGLVHWGLGLPLVAALLVGVCLADPDFSWFLSAANETNSSRPLRRAVKSEGLIEGTAMLVLFVALSDAAMTGHINWSKAVFSLTVGTAVGALVGAAVAFCVLPLFRRLADPRIAVVLSIALPFLAYVPAQALGGVRLSAVVAAGLVTGWAIDPHMHALARLTGRSVWRCLFIVIPGLIYIPAGAIIASGLAEHTVAWVTVALWGFYLALASVAVRFLWVGCIYWIARACRILLGPWRDFAAGLASSTRGVFAIASVLALPAASALGISSELRVTLMLVVLAAVAFSLMIQPIFISRVALRWAVPGDGRESRERELVVRTLAEIDDADAMTALSRKRAALLALRQRGAISGEIFIEAQYPLDCLELYQRAREGKDKPEF